MCDFINLPFEIYRIDSNWVPPLISELKRTLNQKRNPYFQNATLALFVCYADSEPASRSAVVINSKHKEKFGISIAFFGFFESVNDLNAVKALFNSIEVYCREQKVQIIEGPFNPNHYSEIGIQISKFNIPPSFFQNYNPEYYPQLLNEAGFEVHKIIHTRKREGISSYIRQRYGDNIAVYQSSEYTIRNLIMNDFENELERIRDVFNDAFSDNWNFLPLSKEEYLFAAKYLHLVTKPELITIVEHKGNPVGVLEFVEDVNPLLRHLGGKAGPIKYLRYQRDRKKIRELIIYAVGIKKKYRGTRVYKLLLDAACRTALQCDTLECTWTSDDNVLAVHSAEHMGLERDKEFAIYQKKLTNI
jgi:hypothetical protein